MIKINGKTAAEFAQIDLRGPALALFDSDYDTPTLRHELALTLSPYANDPRWAELNDESTAWYFRLVICNALAELTVSVSEINRRKS